MKYAIVTYVFGDYELLREPRVVSGDCDYVCVTDRHDLRSNVWRFVYMQDRGYNRCPGWVKSYIAKNLFLGVTDAEVVIRIDGSVEVLERCDDLVEWFVGRGDDVAVMCHWGRDNALDEYDAWVRERGLGAGCKGYYVDWCGRNGVDAGSRGLVESGFVMCRRSRGTERLFEDVAYRWRRAMEATGDKVEQVWLTVGVKEEWRGLRVCWLYGRQAVNSRWFQMYGHGGYVWSARGYVYDGEGLMLKDYEG